MKTKDFDLDHTPRSGFTSLQITFPARAFSALLVNHTNNLDFFCKLAAPDTLS